MIVINGTSFLTTSVVAILIGLVCFSARIASVESTPIILHPYRPQVLPLKPYEFYEVLVPTKLIEADTGYWIRTSFKGSSSSDIVMKRKNADYDSVRAKYLSESDFNQRFSKAFSKGLRDHRYASEFRLNNNKRYLDDPQGLKYEIVQKEGGEEFLVFVLSVVRVSLAFDEAALYNTVDVSIELMQDSLDSFSTVNSFAVSLVATVVTIGVFLSMVYFVILPQSVRNLLFGIDTNTKAN